MIRISLLAVLIWSTITALGFTLDQPEPEKQNMAEPTHVSQLGDYKIERYELRVGDLIRLKERGIYAVTNITANNLGLTATRPINRGITAMEWEIPIGRGPIGNRNYIDIQTLDETNGTATVLVEWKTRWHWWDALAF
jgi:hypothetical protein